MVVVDVKVTSTDKMNDAFKENDEKYREWATQETREKKVVMAVMVPVIISRWGCPQRLCKEMEDLRVQHQSRLGANGPERPTIQRRYRWEVLQ